MPDQHDTYGNDTTEGTNARRQDLQSLGDQPTANDAPENLALNQTGFELVVLTDRYEIEGELGQGGMGKVLLARDKRLPRQVAIKSLLPELAKSPIGTERFLIEARSAASLNHPNIVQIYDLGMTAQGPFFVMEYVSGGSLQDRLDNGRVEADEAVSIICQLCNAVATAHNAGIIHRDIKPANIMLDVNGTPKLTDFGIARQDSNGHGLTKLGTVLGTIGYMPPEQRYNASAADTRSDIWSLAGTLYRMLTGDPPLVPDLELIPPAYRTTLSKALKLRQEDRFQSALELRKQLIQNTSKSEAKQPEPSAPVDRTPPENTLGVDEQVKDLMDSAKAHYSNYDYQKAIDDYTKAIELMPDDVDAYIKRGGVYQQLDEYQKAMDDYIKAEQLDAFFVSAYCLSAEGRIRRGDIQGAIYDYTTAIEKCPIDIDFYIYRGDLYLNIGEYQKAITDYTKAIEINPETQFVYDKRAIAYRNVGETELAEKDLQTSKELFERDRRSK